MNCLPGKIESITICKNLSLVYIRVRRFKLTAIVIDTPVSAPYLNQGTHVQALFKETEVIIARGTDHTISLQNKLPGKITSIEKGRILSKIILETDAGPITSVITTNAAEQMKLELGGDVTAMIKTNEIMLSE